MSQNIKTRSILVSIGNGIILKLHRINFIITIIKWIVILLNLLDINREGLFYVFIIKTISVFYYQFVILNKIYTDDIFPREV